jgi:molybdopterin molybdotransferase
MLSVEEALQTLLAAARPPSGTVELPTEQTLGRVLATPLTATVTVPPLDNAAMDGYAVRAAEIAEGGVLPVSQRIPAGSLGQPLAPGSVARIFTGAPVPEGADTVVMQEDTEVVESGVRFLRRPKSGQHVRRAGEDIRPGQTVLVAGDRLGPAQLGVIASCGVTSLPVFRRLKVAVFFTGDELVMPGAPLPPGRIYNSNRAFLIGLLTQLGCEVVDFGQVPDNAESTRTTLDRASREADVVMTTGGVSVGEEDHVKAAVESLGRLDMWKVAMKPGKPLAFGRVGEADFIGLPGNPVSAYVVFCLFAAPFLRARMGETPRAQTAFTVPVGVALTKLGNRREFMRARMENGHAVLFPNQSSGVLTSLAWASGLVDLAAGSSLAPGDPVRFIPLSELLP